MPGGGGIVAAVGLHRASPFSCRPNRSPCSSRRPSSGAATGSGNAPAAAPLRHIILPRERSARAASAADSTFFTSSGGGSTALKPIDSIHISRAQPRV